MLHTSFLAAYPTKFAVELLYNGAGFLAFHVRTVTMPAEKYFVPGNGNTIWLWLRRTLVLSYYD